MAPKQLIWKYTGEYFSSFQALAIIALPEFPTLCKIHDLEWWLWSYSVFVTTSFYLYNVLYNGQGEGLFLQSELLYMYIYIIMLNVQLTLHFKT